MSTETIVLIVVVALLFVMSVLLTLRASVARSRGGRAEQSRADVGTRL